MKRTLKPRASIALTPCAITQRNVEAVLGVDARRWLELLRVHTEVPVARIGKLRVVDFDAARELLRRLSKSAPPTPSNDDDVPQPETADQVLRGLGLRVVGSGRG